VRAGARDKLATLGWFARRPMLWPQAGQIIRRRLSPNRDSPEYQRAAGAWCDERAISTADALRTLGFAGEVIPFEQREGELYRLALERCAACPVPMGGSADLTLLFGCAELLAARRVLETGVAYGWSTLAILASLRNRRDAVLQSVDMPYVKRNNDPYVGVAVPPSLRPQWHLHRMADRQGIPRALTQLDGTIDMCHYDSDKTYSGRRWAYPVLWTALRSGGLLISDDVGDNLAFREFSDDLGVSPLVVRAEGRFAGVLRKP
jgi:hypothetical protein